MIPAGNRSLSKAIMVFTFSVLLPQACPGTVADAGFRDVDCRRRPPSRATGAAAKVNRMLTALISHETTAP